MADEESTRSETVAENIQNVISKFGAEAWPQICTQCLKDISLSLATLVDNQAQSEE